MTGAGKEKYQIWFWCAFKKFKFNQTPVQLHYVDDILYVIKLWIGLDNSMVVQCIENSEDPETEDAHNMAIHNANVLELDEEEVRDES